MSGTFVSIAGVDNKMKKILSERAKIETLKRFWEETRTPEERALLAEKVKLPLGTINHWAVQAELLRMDTMSYDMAYEFVDAGIYTVKEIQTSSASVILEKLKEVNPRTNITEDVILKLQNAAVKPARDFVCSKSFLNDATVTEDTTPNIYSNLSNVITELGKGVGQAQHELDLNSLKIQNDILKDDRLYGMGLQATWYVMPEVEFTMKMDYSVYEERTESGEIKPNSTKISILPSNATYSNLFKSSKKEESSVRLRIVPIPANDKFVKRRYMPNLLGKDKDEDKYVVSTIGELKSELESVGISSYEILPIKEAGWDDSVQIQVLKQAPNAGTLLELGDVPVVEVNEIKISSTETKTK